ncbi:Peptidase family M23 [Austwickia chelonae]|uniref:M23ase beta-sheet core domain-containing protein n=1 Tax=Austwickia chelonae NBRC 105200 TaxID=1184607 RepID=K6VIL0_9MICO|nr:M23 family metallopeptidase [Austwickia chelonae]GAB76554.1 hypothetical protein AUCHE_01_01160 [Austwickia chelonae NBRC 105200]SEW26733.1 Peptidase family M23 [Austwickia chelonae]
MIPAVSSSLSALALSGLFPLLVLPAGPPPENVAGLDPLPAQTSLTVRQDAEPAEANTPGTRRARWQWPLSPKPPVVRPFDAPPQPWLAGHRGVDLLSTRGSAVRAPATGIVAFRGSVAGRPVLSIDHPGGLRSTYEPVSSSLTPGTPVAAGQVIGQIDVDASHCAPQTCLHWGLRRGETYLDPLRMIRLAPIVLRPTTG